MSWNKTKPRGGAIYRQERIRDVTLFTSQGAAALYDELCSTFAFDLPRAATGRKSFLKEAMPCAVLPQKTAVREGDFGGSGHDTSKHTYFELLCLEWGDRLKQAKPQNYENVLDLLPRRKPVQKKMVREYRYREDDQLSTSQFQPQPMSLRGGGNQLAGVH